VIQIDYLAHDRPGIPLFAGEEPSDLPHRVPGTNEVEI
jgi:hypothetical protein